MRHRVRTVLRVAPLFHLLVVPMAYAQSGPGSDRAIPAEEEQGQGAKGPVSIADIVVTGSRIVRDGYDAPTPVSVITEAEIAKSAPVTVADYVNQLPALNGSQTPRTSLSSTNNGITGANLLNLRNLGVNRTLVLLNGRRVTPSTVTAAVDINTLPQSLVKRVDVVTGGASAAWGSDAVSGVVNFVLDNELQGLKGNIQGGVTSRGDGKNVSADLSWGTSFADGRGHFVISGQYSNQHQAFLRKRGWYEGYKLLVNPAFAPGNGEPARLILPNTGVNLTREGLITSGPLRGTAFDANGQVSTTTFPFAPVASGFLQSGGTANYDMTRDVVQVLTPVEQGSIFAHGSYDISDNLTAYVEGSYGDSRSGTMTGYFWRVNNEVIRSDNAFLPDSVRSRLAAAGATSFNLSHANADLGVPTAVNDRSLVRGLAGLNGKLGGGWTWSAYYQFGESKITNRVKNNLIPTNILSAIDSVQSADGTIVCRSTLTAPTNGCVPYNPFGTRAVTDAQRNYMSGTSEAHLRLRQHVFEASIQGDLFDLPAGPVSVVAGGDYRRDSGGVLSTDPISAVGRWYVGNLAPFRGQITVKEGFGEIAVPILKDSAFGQSLDLSAAVRFTDYSTSGSVTTWKAGLTYRPIDDIEFRVTRSRDIRAPNLNDLYQGGTTLVQFLNDPTRNNASIAILQTIKGNRDLAPERANSLTVGAVLRPSFLPGFTASVDFYDIKIKDAIATNSSQQIVNLCAAGSTLFCSAIGRNPDGTLATVSVIPFNARSEVARGVDIEMGYRTDLMGGSFDLRALANYANRLDIVSPFGVVTRAGEVANNLGTSQGVPSWKALVSATFALDPVTVQLKGRFIGASQIEQDYGPLDINRNHVPAILYLDAFLGYDLKIGGGKVQLYVAADNVLDQDPPIVVSQDPLVNQASGTNPVIYDAIGRSFRGGVRFQF